MMITEDKWRQLKEALGWRHCFEPIADSGSVKITETIRSDSGSVKITYKQGRLVIYIATAEDYFGTFYTELEWVGGARSACSMAKGYLKIKDFQTSAQVAVILTILGVLPEKVEA